MSDLRSKVIRLAHEKPELREALLPLLKTASGPSSNGSNWKERTGKDPLTDSMRSWSWTDPSGLGPNFKVTEHQAPFGLYYKMRMLVSPGGSEQRFFETKGQKLDPETWFARAAKLYKLYNSNVSFDLRDQPERWSPSLFQ